MSNWGKKKPNTDYIFFRHNEKKLQIKLTLCITFYFIMELLSFSDNMKVIKPKSLIKETHHRAFKQY